MAICCQEIVMKSGGVRMLVPAPMVHAEWSVVRLLYQHFVAVPDLCRLAARAIGPLSRHAGTSVVLCFVPFPGRLSWVLSR